MHVSRQQLKSSMLPVAIMTGALFYKWMGYLSFLSPYLIFLMLFITYCKLDVRQIRPTRGHLLLLVAQFALSAAFYLLSYPLGSDVAEGLFICVIMPTATAAPVITAMLGGSISYVATYSLTVNMVVAIFGPAILAAVGEATDLTFMQSMLLILSKVFPLLIAPLLLALILGKVTPKVHKAIKEQQQLSFYIWAVALVIVVGNCVSFMINHWDENRLTSIIWMAAGAGVACLVQFWTGRHIGKRLEDNMQRDGYKAGVSKGEKLTVSCAQSLMQKNTVLGVWLAMTYMQPMASVAPAAYIIWHNVVNSWQIAKKK